MEGLESRFSRLVACFTICLIILIGSTCAQKGQYINLYVHFAAFTILFFH